MIRHQQVLIARRDIALRFVHIPQAAQFRLGSYLLSSIYVLTLELHSIAILLLQELLLKRWFVFCSPLVYFAFRGILEAGTAYLDRRIHCGDCANCSLSLARRNHCMLYCVPPRLPQDESPSEYAITSAFACPPYKRNAYASNRNILTLPSNWNVWLPCVHHC